MNFDVTSYVESEVDEAESQRKMSNDGPWISEPQPNCPGVGVIRERLRKVRGRNILEVVD